MYVVERQVTRAHPAILAGVVIAPEHILAVKSHTLVVRAFDIFFELDDARHDKNLTRGAEDFVTILEPFRDVVHQE